jgi:hypothetical protein
MGGLDMEPLRLQRSGIFGRKKKLRVKKKKLSERKKKLGGYEWRRRNKPLHVRKQWPYGSKRKLCENIKENKKDAF